VNKKFLAIAGLSFIFLLITTITALSSSDTFGAYLSVKDHGDFQSLQKDSEGWTATMLDLEGEEYELFVNQDFFVTKIIKTIEPSLSTEKDPYRFDSTINFSTSYFANKPITIIVKIEQKIKKMVSTLKTLSTRKKGGSGGTDEFVQVLEEKVGDLEIARKTLEKFGCKDFRNIDSIINTLKAIIK